MPRVTNFYKKSFRTLFQSTQAIKIKMKACWVCILPKPHRHQTAMDHTKVKTYQSLLFCPAYLFSLEDLKRRWCVVTFCLEITTCRILFVLGCKALNRLITHVVLMNVCTRQSVKGPETWRSKGNRLPE